MEQMTRINLWGDEIQDFVTTNVQPVINNKKDKQVSFSDQLSLQAIANPRNQGALLSKTHNLNHVHVDEEVVETTLAILSLRSGKDIPDTYKDHPIPKAQSLKIHQIASSTTAIRRTRKNRLRLNLTLIHTNLLCLILKHLIAPRPRQMNQMITY